MIRHGSDQGNWNEGPTAKALADIRADDSLGNARFVDEKINQRVLRRIDEFDKALGLGLREIHRTQESITRVLRENEQLTIENAQLRADFQKLQGQLKTRFANIDKKLEGNGQ